MAFQVIDASKTLKYLSDVALRQLPFAASKSLNDTAFKAREFIIRDMPNVFTLRNKWVQRGVRVKKSKKKSLLVKVFHRDQFLEKQEEGGILRGKGNRLAIPDKIRKNPRRRITRAKRPRVIIKKRNVYKGKFGILQRTKRKPG